MSQIAVEFWNDVYVGDAKVSNLFTDLLYHNEHNSYAFLNIKSAGHMKQRAYVNKCALCSAANADAATDTWISLNLFKSGKSRAADNCRELTAFYIDLDKHDAPKNKIQKAISNSTNLLYELIDKKIIPQPTIITRTGRGLGIYYVLNNTIAITKNTEKQQKLYAFIYSKLADIFSHYYSSTTLLECDRVVVNDRTRIVRMPGTYNTAAEDYCSIIDVGEGLFGVSYYDMSDFNEYIQRFDEMQIKKMKKPVAKNNIVSFTAYNSSFLFNRIQQMIKLQQNFNAACINKRREYMCFIYYNAAKQVYPDAGERLVKFNDGFAKPLELKEIKHVIKSVDNNVAETHIGYYKLSDKWIIDKLQLTDEELAVTYIGQSQRFILREAAKEHTKNKRAERDSNVIECIRKGYTYVQTADKVNVSVSTIKRIVKKYAIQKIQKDIHIDEKSENASGSILTSKNNYLFICAAIKLYVAYITKTLECVNKKVQFLSLCLWCVVCFVCVTLLFVVFYMIHAPPFFATLFANQPCSAITRCALSLCSHRVSAARG